MPLVSVKLTDGSFTREEKHAMAKDLTEVMVKYEGSEAFREVVWVMIEELPSDCWYIAGRPFSGAGSIMQNLANSKKIFEMIDGNPTSKSEFSRALPVKKIYKP
ncbi:tautomerase family protein [Pseudomonas abietaniphila]|uniref:2-hydroxymuconate tautomerase n=1 Tax=Pseudomonas abietaniphila TaxID=89065 RepID=A0A1G8PUE7_9PSED|nr:tautomerase family protein [Pseudomonas abietaniphila]SDI96087.1 4-oxalocrotonate tautomerase [Pseudomonas abietaniphila]